MHTPPFIVAALALTLAACGQRNKPATVNADTVRLNHASLLTMVEADSFTLVAVADPWHKGKELRRYVLIDRNRPQPGDLPEGTVVRVPLQQAIVFSTVHCALLYDLGKIGAVAGLCDSQYALHGGVRGELAAGRLPDAGSSMTPDAERLFAMHPDALLASPYESGGHGQLEKTGIPLIECADYAETSALGRAEWMRFYGRLFGCGERADSLFAAVEQRYEKLRRQADAHEPHPTLLVDKMDGGTWYVPAGRSTMGRLYADAGTRYLFADREGTASVPLGFETVFSKAADADFWLIKYGQRNDLTYAQLADDYPPYARFRAYQEHRVYGCNTSRVPFYDEVPFRPDRLLEELVALFHHDADYHPHYFTPLQ